MNDRLKQEEDPRMVPSREDMALSVDEAEWGWLRAHLERGGLIIVEPYLDIVDVGLMLAADDADSIRKLIADNRLTKPSPAQIATWDDNRSKRFLSLIVSPYVLIQENPERAFHC